MVELHRLEMEASKAWGEQAAQSVVRHFRRSDKQAALLTERYDGGWKATYRCVRSLHPDLDWSAVENAYAAGAY